jgi:hypothetical protein
MKKIQYDWQKAGPKLLEAMEEIDHAVSSGVPEHVPRIVECTWNELLKPEYKLANYTM